MLAVPIQPGEDFDAKVRAVAPAGWQCGTPPAQCPYSDWTTAKWLWPAEQTNGHHVLSFESAQPMAISYVNGNASKNSGDSTTIASVALNVTGGNALFVAVSAYDVDGTVTGVSDTAGNTYVRAGSEEGGDATHKASIWYALNITGNASNVVTATYTGISGYRCIAVAQFSGIATTGAYDQASTANITASGTTHTSNNTGATTQSNEVVISSHVAWGLPQTLTATAPTVLGPNSTDNNAIAYKIVSATGAQSTTLTTSSATTYFIQTRTFKADTGGAAQTALPRRAFDGPFSGPFGGSVQ